MDEEMIEIITELENDPTYELELAVGASSGLIAEIADAAIDRFHARALIPQYNSIEIEAWHSEVMRYLRKKYTSKS